MKNIRIPTRKTKVMIQGIMNSGAAVPVEQAIVYGTNIVAGVTHEKGVKEVLGVPVFQTVKGAVKNTKPDVCVVFSSPSRVYGDVKEVAKEKVPLIVCTSERVPVQDALHIRSLGKRYGVNILGPSSPGVVVPGECVAGTMPVHVFGQGNVAIVARSSSLSYEAMQQLSAAGLGVSVCFAIGATPVLGTGFVPVVQALMEDVRTKAILVIGEMDGEFEMHLAEYYGGLKKKKQMFAYIAGKTAPRMREQEMLGTEIPKPDEWIQRKTKALRKAGVIIIDELHMIGKKMVGSAKSNFGGR